MVTMEENFNEMSGILNPVVELCALEVDSALAKQDQLGSMLDNLIDNMMKIKDLHFSGKDTKIQEYLNKAISEQKRLGLVTGKLNKLQSNVEKIEKNYNRLKKEIPQLDAVSKEKS